MKTKDFEAGGSGVLIGSLPVEDHGRATQMVLAHTPDIPLWVQLPCYPEEGMLRQFLPGFPGLTRTGDKLYIDTAAGGFEESLAAFYEDYLAAEDPGFLNGSRFALTQETARGFFVFLETVQALPRPPKAVKGQVTGPVTMGIGLKDQDGRAVFYDDRLRDAMVKHLALKARWQVERLSGLGACPIVFFDEPGLVSFGTSAFISISREQVLSALDEVIDGVQAAGGLAGIHICANADWSLALASKVDIISFDAFSFFDRFILYPDLVKAFLESGRTLAWGIVPTAGEADVQAASADTLFQLWQEQLGQVASLGIEQKRVIRQSLITPSCGTGSLSLEHAVKVLELTRDVSRKVVETLSK